MTEKYYNVLETNKIVKMSEIDVPCTIEMIEEYIKEYPNDYYIYALYISNLIKIGNFKAADILLDKLKSVDAKKSYKNTTKEKLLKKSIIIARIKILSYQNKCEDLLKYAAIHRKFLLEQGIHLGIIIDYCRIKLNRSLSNNESEDYYMFQQMKNYSEELLKEHLRKLTFSEYEESDDIKIPVLSQDFPIEKIIEEVKKYIPNDNKACLGFIDDTYYFKYDNAGRFISDTDRNITESKKGNNHLSITDYFKVVTFKGTKDIITIRPCDNTKGFEYIDLNYLKEKEETKVLRKSAIEKFNERYSK